MGRNKSAPVGHKMWWCLSSVLRGRVAAGLHVHPKLSKQDQSCIACTTCTSVCVCVSAQSSLIRKQKEQGVPQRALLFCSRFTKVSTSKAGMAFLRLSGFKLCCYCSRGLPQIKYFYCRAASLENVLFAVFHAGLGRIMTLNGRNTS